MGTELPLLGCDIFALRYTWCARHSHSDAIRSRSGLMECPCTDRYPKKMSSYSTLKTGTCNPVVLTETDCLTAAKELGLNPILNMSTVDNALLPTGCSVQPTVGGFDVVFNTAQNGAKCGEQKPSGPVLSHTCNISGAWEVVKNSKGTDPKTPIMFLPGKTPNTYIVPGTQGSPTRATINVSAPTAANPEGLVSGNWLSKGTYKNIPATLSTFQAQSTTTIPPCSQMSWGNGVVMVRKEYANLPAKPAQLARVSALGEDLVNVSVDVDPNKDLVTIRLSGPSDVWFGVGLGAASHSADPSDPSTGLSMLGTNWTVRLGVRCPRVGVLFD